MMGRERGKRRFSEVRDGIQDKISLGGMVDMRVRARVTGWEKRNIAASCEEAERSKGGGDVRLGCLSVKSSHEVSTDRRDVVS